MWLSIVIAEMWYRNVHVYFEIIIQQDQPKNNVRDFGQYYIDAILNTIV